MSNTIKTDLSSFEFESLQEQVMAEYWAVLESKIKKIIAEAKKRKGLAPTMNHYFQDNTAYYARNGEVIPLVKFTLTDPTMNTNGAQTELKSSLRYEFL